MYSLFGKSSHSVSDGVENTATSNLNSDKSSAHNGTSIDSTKRSDYNTEACQRDEHHIKDSVSESTDMAASHQCMESGNNRKKKKKKPKIKKCPKTQKSNNTMSNESDMEGKIVDKNIQDQHAVSESSLSGSTGSEDVLSGNSETRLTKDNGDDNKSQAETRAKISSGYILPSTKSKKLQKSLSRTLSNLDFENCNPEICVTLMHRPSIQSVGALKRKLKSCTTEWLQSFVKQGGLDNLLDFSIGDRHVIQLSDALLLLECISCIRVVMNSRQGLEYIINTNYTKKLVKSKYTNIFHV